MLLDPSRTGSDPGGRATFLHQDQWVQLPGAWGNDLLAAEWCARNQRKQVDSWFGVGLIASREQQGTTGSRGTTVGLASASHLRSGQRSFLSAGLHVRWANTAADPGTGAWGSQYDGMHHDPGLASGEAFNAYRQTWMTARVGFSFTLKCNEESPRRRERNILVVGVAADDLGHLVLSEQGMPVAPLPVRSTVYAQGELPMERWSHGFLAAEVIGQLQGPFHTARFNVYAGKHLLNRTRVEGGPALMGFKAGVGYRLGDALLANAALDLGQFTFGLAYGWAVFTPDKPVAGRRTLEALLQWGWEK